MPDTCGAVSEGKNLSVRPIRMKLCSQQRWGRRPKFRQRRDHVSGNVASMSDGRTMSSDREGEKGSWGEIFRDGRGLYSALLIGGIAMQATQMLVIAIIM